jgi:hypothetical protein
MGYVVYVDKQSFVTRGWSVTGRGYLTTGRLCCTSQSVATLEALTKTVRAIVSRNKNMDRFGLSQGQPCTSALEENHETDRSPGPQAEANLITS